MTGPAPMEYGWWLASRAAGVVALLCVALSVGIGLAMASRIAPKRAQALLDLHQHTALAGLVAIAVHGITLMGDRFLHPGPAEIAVPFLIEHARVWTGLGVTAGWLAAILGLSYWLRDRIGQRRWRSLHKATLLVYVLAVGHTLGAGSDASSLWLRGLLLATGAPILFLFLLRVLPQPKPPAVFRRMRVTAVVPESADVTSFALEPADRKPLAPFAPGQFVTLKTPAGVRSYSLSAWPGRYRISVRRQGAVSGYLHAAVGEGDVVEVAEPRGTFVLDPHPERPVVLLSAGVGATPVLAMLHALAAQGSPREIWWIHGARCGSEHAFREEVRELIARLPAAHSHVRYSRPDPRDRDHDAVGRIEPEILRELDLPLDAAFHLCGPAPFLDALTAALRDAGVPEGRIRSERFASVQERGQTPFLQGGAAVAFNRSGVQATWERGSLLDLAEAHGVQPESGCRMGACHACATPVLDGEVDHDPAPMAPPPDGSALLCCARPRGDVVLDA
jgi:ferredoxin-NADP reductase